VVVDFLLRLSSCLGILCCIHLEGLLPMLVLLGFVVLGLGENWIYGGLNW
jgi:hypothetical protein